MKFYSGIGSRETPIDICEMMQRIAFKLSQEGWMLRSGGAPGADSAFYEGASNSFSECTPEIYLPWYGFNSLYTEAGLLYPSTFKNWEEAKEIAKHIHPNWDACKDGARSLHSRNIYQVLGQDLSTPSKFLICWAKEDKQGNPTGGTRTAYMLAINNNIPCFNLFNEDDRNRIKLWLGRSV